ncbi:MAG: Rieske 2Fe-2S domain-containing protein [Deltaproteobacteria bacterium]|nr:Rieske 2Fe-2S domain-containing protein [Deltaproteobacteria bacterium]
MNPALRIVDAAVESAELPIPNGWFAILSSRELKKKAVRPVRAFGKELVAFRGDDGRVTVLDAHCPHLGAHMGYGGKVVGDELQCPFHAWRFDKGGHCTHVPFAKKLPVARTRCWQVHETGGLIFVHHDRTGAPPATPPPDLSMFARWTRPIEDRSEYRGHPIEAAENVIDAGHFVYFHGAREPAALDFSANGATASMKTAFALGGLLSGVTAQMAVELYGPGLLFVRTKLLVDVVVITTPLPIEPGRTLFRMSVVAEKPRWFPLFGRIAAEIIRRRAAYDAKHERAIWEHKVYVPAPRLSSVDRHIQPFRRWYAQFL